MVVLEVTQVGISIKKKKFWHSFSVFIHGRYFGVPCWMAFKTLCRVTHDASRSTDRAFPFSLPDFTESLIILIVWHISGFTSNLLRAPYIHFAVPWIYEFLSAKRAQFSLFVYFNAYSTYKPKVSDKRVTQTADPFVFSACTQHWGFKNGWHFLLLVKCSICPRFNIKKIS